MLNEVGRRQVSYGDCFFAPPAGWPDAHCKDVAQLQIRKNCGFKCRTPSLRIRHPENGYLL